MPLMANEQKNRVMAVFIVIYILMEQLALHVSMRYWFDAEMRREQLANMINWQ